VPRSVCLSRISVTDPPSNHVQPFRLSEILGVRNLFVQIFEDVLAAWRRGLGDFETLNRMWPAIDKLWDGGLQKMNILKTLQWASMGC
jgi:hypothetical protein